MLCRFKVDVVITQAPEVIKCLIALFKTDTCDSQEFYDISHFALCPVARLTLSTPFLLPSFSRSSCNQTSYKCIRLIYIIRVKREKLEISSAAKSSKRYFKDARDLRTEIN